MGHCNCVDPHIPAPLPGAVVEGDKAPESHRIGHLLSPTAEIVSRKRAQLEADLSLAILAAILEPGQTLTLEEIAEISGLSRARIQQIERSALKKLRKRLSKAGLRPEDLHFTDHRFAHRADRSIHE